MAHPSGEVAVATLLALFIGAYFGYQVGKAAAEEEMAPLTHEEIQREMGRLGMQ
jgi:hypothetical protein